MDIPLLPLAIVAAAGVFLALQALTAPPTVRLEKPQRGLLRRLQAHLDAAELPVTAREFTSLCLVLGLAVAGVAVLLGTPALALAGLVVVPAMLWQRYETRRDTFRQAYDESLAECVQLVREAFSATGTLPDALDHVARNGPDPAAADFREVWGAYTVGADFTAAFAPIVERRRNPYLRMVAEALTLKTQEGGNAGQVLLGLEEMIRGNVALKREIAAKQAQARLESTVVCLAPLGFFLAMKVLPWMREYEQGFYASALGQLVLSLAIVFSMAAYFLARRLGERGLNLEVKPVDVGLAGVEVAQ